MREVPSTSRILTALPVAALVAGVALVVYSVLVSAASVSLVVFVPVLTGRSTAFLGGVALLVVGFLTLPLTFAGPALPGTPSPASPAGSPQADEEVGPTGVGGLVLLGPVPIFFGSWSRVSRRVRWAAVLLGVAVLAGLLVVFLVAR
ncbi:MAG: TIGR00304 family membrane protein [Thermoplasmata archaeon]